MKNITKNATLNGENATLNLELKIKKQYPKLRKVYIDIIKMILEDKYITQEEIADKLGKNRSSIYRNIKTLRSMGVLERIGAKKKGYWKILLDLQ